MSFSPKNRFIFYGQIEYSTFFVEISIIVVVVLPFFGDFFFVDVEIITYLE
jgi:hypothetical protein